MKIVKLASMFFFILVVLGCSSYEKQTKTVTKVVSHDDMYWIERNQRSLVKKLQEENTSDAIIEEVQQGVEMIRSNLDFMVDHPEYDLVEIEFPVNKYIDSHTEFEYMSDMGVIKRVHSEENGWQDY